MCLCVCVRSVSCPQACLCVRSRRAAMCTRVSSSRDSRGSALSSIPSDAPPSASRIELAAQKSAKRLCWRPPHSGLSSKRRANAETEKSKLGEVAPCHWPKSDGRRRLVSLMLLMLIIVAAHYLPCAISAKNHLFTLDGSSGTPNFATKLRNPAIKNMAGNDRDMTNTR